MFLLNDTIFLRGVRTSGLMDNAMISTKGTNRGILSYDNMQFHALIS